MENRTEQLLRQLKALGDPWRLRLYALCRHGECSVNELTRVLAQSQPRVSQHLKQLVDAGLLERFRDGKRVFYRVPGRGAGGRRQLLALIPADEPQFHQDGERLRELRGSVGQEAVGDEPGQRSVHRAILDQTVAAPVGDLLDIGCGHGRILKLLASRANRAIGIDTDPGARDIARAELLLAGLPNCSLRQGDMYGLPFLDGEFDTIILDDVLANADAPVSALREARRLLKPSGRLFVLIDLHGLGSRDIQTQLAQWSASAGLRLAPARLVPKSGPTWLLSVATLADSGSRAA